MLGLLSSGAACPTQEAPTDAGPSDAGLSDAGVDAPSEDCFVVGVTELGNIDLTTGTYTALQTMTLNGGAYASTSYESLAGVDGNFYFCDLAGLARVDPDSGEVSYTDDVRCLGVVNWADGLLLFRESLGAFAGHELAFFDSAAMGNRFDAPTAVYPIDLARDRTLMAASEGILYFVRSSSPEFLERYDVEADTFLTRIRFPDEPGEVVVNIAERRPGELIVVRSTRLSSEEPFYLEFFDVQTRDVTGIATSGPVSRRIFCPGS